MIAVTAQEMREMDRLTIQEYGVPSLILMERAGIAVAEALMGSFGRAARRGVLVVAGKGNNGGDGKEGVRGIYAEAIKMMNGSGLPIVAVDLPSGLDSDRGRSLGATIKASLTVALGFPKLGEVIYPGLSFVGRLEAVEIGIPGQGGGGG